MTQPTIIHFVRHGKVHKPVDICYGRLPRFRLSPRGLVQAEKAARVLEPLGIDLLFSSPLLRTRQTAKVIASLAGISAPKISSLLNEVHMPYDGRPTRELDAIGWDLYTGAPPQYEQPADIQQRLEKFVRRVESLYPGRRIVAVTHGDVIAFLYLWAKGYAVSVENRGRLQALGYPDAYPAFASITTLTLDDGARGVHYQQVENEFF